MNSEDHKAYKYVKNPKSIFIMITLYVCLESKTDMYEPIGLKLDTYVTYSEFLTHLFVEPPLPYGFEAAVT